MSNIAMQLTDIGAICASLVQNGKGESKLKLVQIRILFKLNEFSLDPSAPDGMRVEDLARCLATERPSISRELAKLRVLGLVCIAPPKLRTSGYILTQLGRHELVQLDEATKRVDKLILTAIRDKDGDLLKSRLRKILQLMPLEYTDDRLKITLLRESKRSRAGPRSLR
jgi:DNA-binding MarR family transcriptional regulator